MGQTPSILPYDTGNSFRRPRLVGLYILGSIEILLALAIIGDALLHGLDIGTSYETPTDRPVMQSLLLAGGVLFFAALSTLLWRLLRRGMLLVLQGVAALCQLPAIREAHLDLAEATRRGGDWAGLSTLGTQCTILLILACALIATLLFAYLWLPKARQAFT